MPNLPLPHLLATVRIDIEDRLLLVLIQLILIIIAARIFAALFRRLGQPAVVGEIFAGLVLGPSVLGKLETAGIIPPISAYVFDPAVAPVFTILSQIGLILLLFLIGLEFDFGHLRARETGGRAALGISIAGIAIPFILGIAIGHVILPHLPENPPRLGFLLFMGTALAITALPVLGRILMELNISRTRVGTIAITAAAVNDAIGWIILAAVSALVQSRFQMLHTLGMIGLTAAFVLAMILLVRPAMRWWIARTFRDGRADPGLTPMATVLVILFLCAIATNLIGICAIFGAFLFGAILCDQHAFRDSIGRSFREFITVFFLPIFFTYTGLRTDIGTLQTPALWLLAGAVLLVAIAGKFGGCAAAARLSGFSWRDSACVGILMNTRGLMELVVVNVGYDLKVIPQSVYCMLVLMAVITTVMTTPLLLATTRGTELEAPLRQSGFGRARRGEPDFNGA